MIKKDNLRVVLALNFGACAIVTTLYRRIGVHVNDLSVTSVSEKQAGFRVCVHLEVRRVIVVNRLTLPRVVAQVCGLGHDLFTFVENETEVLSFHAICQVYIGTYLLLFALFSFFISPISYEKNSCQSSIAQTFFSLSQGFKKRIVLDFAALMG